MRQIPRRKMCQCLQNIPAPASSGRLGSPRPAHGMGKVQQLGQGGGQKEDVVVEGKQLRQKAKGMEPPVSGAHFHMERLHPLMLSAVIWTGDRAGKQKQLMDDTGGG